MESLDTLIDLLDQEMMTMACSGNLRENFGMKMKTMMTRMMIEMRKGKGNWIEIVHHAVDHLWTLMT